VESGCDVVDFLFLLLSTLVVFNVAGATCGFETLESVGVVEDCFFFVTFEETDVVVSFVVEDLRRVTVGLTACVLFTLKA